MCQHGPAAHRAGREHVESATGRLLVVKRQPVFAGRSRECAQLEQLLGRVRAGTSSVLVLRGEAGAGKTALLDHARAAAAGMTVLATVGAELESELAFAALAELLRPILDYLDRIPTRQSAVLMGALALGPPVVGDRFTICAATLSLITAAAEGQPVMILVDDAGRLDASSAEALVFAARRLDAESVVMLAAVREGDDSAFLSAGLPELVVAGLDRESARTVLATGGADVSDAALDRLYGSTGGNPLALIEMGSLVTPGQLAGTEPFDDPLPAVGVESVYLAEIERLTADTRRALMVAAVSGDSSQRDAIARTCAALGIDPNVLEAALAAGVLRSEAGGVRFRHPLLREAVYRAASPAVRRSTHRAVAAGLESTADVERRALHLAAAAPVPDEGVAAGLEQTGLSARLRGAHAVAASAFERAARLTPDGHERGRRLLQAGSGRLLLGESERAVVLLDEALVLNDDPLVAADAHRLRGRAEMWQGAPMAAHAMLVDEASRVEPADPERAALMLVEAGVACLMTWSLDEAETTARRARTIAERVGGEAAMAAALMLGHVLTLRGDPAGAGIVLGQAAYLENADSPLQLAHLIPSLVLPLIWLEYHERARAVILRATDEARALSAPSPLPQLLGFRSGLEYRTGQWGSAVASAGESVRLAVETGQASESAHGLVCLARLEAALGREAECVTHANAALVLADRFGLDSVRVYIRASLGHLHLALGRPDAALAALDYVAQATRERGLREPSALLWEPDLIEALVRANRHGEAAEALEEFERRATLLGPAAAANRCRGLVYGETAAFERALVLHDRLWQPFERARTELAFGEHLRRKRRIADARPHLGAALEIFTRLGADPWASRGRSELGASSPGGGHAHTSLSALTCQELEVALKVADGLTNREVGAALFLSHKTIETHLGRVYRKLGLRSRTELTRLLASHALEYEPPQA
jgi:DNA-binding CsgD family transcriptional regulator